jgi:hypothetical protein
MTHEGTVEESKKKQDTMWEYWINEPVYLDGGVFNIVKRKQAIAIFVKEGLVPFIEKSGYYFEYSDVKLAHILLTVLYRLYEGKQILAHPRYDKYVDEQMFLYDHLFDTMAWDRFWSVWGSYQDFQEGRFGESLRYKLPGLVWSWIDLERSPRAIRLEKDLEEQENQEEFPKGKEDPYLQDTVKRDYQDRHW